MQKAYLNYIKYALKQGYKIALEVEGEIVLKSSGSYKAIKDEVEAYDAEVVLIVRDVEAKETLGVAVVILEYGQEPEESIVDYTVTPYNDKWAEQYYK